jgi:hypothetical protein
MTPISSLDIDEHLSDGTMPPSLLIAMPNGPGHLNGAVLTVVRHEDLRDSLPTEFALLFLFACLRAPSLPAEDLRISSCVCGRHRREELNAASAGTDRCNEAIRATFRSTLPQKYRHDSLFVYCESIVFF